MKTKLMSPSMGLEVTDFDLAHLQSHNAGELLELLYHYKILVFRCQAMDNNAYIGLAEKLGSICKYPFSEGLDGYPQIVQIKKTPEQKKNFSEMWHVDSTYLNNPPDFTLLSAEVTPTLGGDTVFSNATLAFESLSGRLKDLLRGLDCLYVSDLHNQDRTQHLANNIERATFKSIHPAVKVHPFTRKESLYINQEHASCFVGMSREESIPLINYLTDFIKRSEFTLRLKWEAGTIALWDNRCVQHHAVNDYTGHLRIMNRITLMDRGVANEQCFAEVAHG